MPSDTRIPSHITERTPLFPAINAWRIFLSDQGKSPHTVKAFTADVLLLANYLPPDRSLGAITTNELNNFLDWMQKRRGYLQSQNFSQADYAISVFSVVGKIRRDQSGPAEKFLAIRDQPPAAVLSKKWDPFWRQPMAPAI
jgi:hypothetical protein